MHIKILGSGCKKCIALSNNARQAMDTAWIDGEIEKVTNIIDIARYGIMATPGLVIDETVVSSGRVLSATEIEPLLKKV